MAPSLFATGRLLNPYAFKHLFSRSSAALIGRFIILSPSSRLLCLTLDFDRTALIGFGHYPMGVSKIHIDLRLRQLDEKPALSSNIAHPLISGRFADFHVVICQVKARVSRARSGERANQQFQDVLRATVCLSASVPALGRTRHPFAVSGSEEPSPKIEFVFSASPETIRREPREGDLLRSVGNMQDLAVCAFCSSC